VQPAVVVHVVLVRRGRGMSDFRTGEWVGMSAGCGLGLRGSRSQRLCKYIIEVILHRDERKVKVTMSLRSLRTLR